MYLFISYSIIIYLFYYYHYLFCILCSIDTEMATEHDKTLKNGKYEQRWFKLACIFAYTGLYIATEPKIFSVKGLNRQCQCAGWKIPSHTCHSVSFIIYWKLKATLVLKYCWGIPVIIFIARDFGRTWRPNGFSQCKLRFVGTT